MKEDEIKEIIEACAAIEHERWAKWYLWQRDNSTHENLARWDRQAKTPYAELTEEEKEKDREQVYPYVDIIKMYGNNSWDLIIKRKI
uniref:Putative ryanodine receptor, RyR, domain containing protein n=1 Tax=viral metagenome TaxID=1070528 RepID=A0A6H1ZC13_9ZZZZ